MSEINLFFLTNSDSALIISYIYEHVRFETKAKLCELRKRDHLSDLSGHLKISIYNFSPMMIVPSYWTQGSPRKGKAISPNKKDINARGPFNVSKAFESHAFKRTKYKKRRWSTALDRARHLGVRGQRWGKPSAGAECQSSAT